MLDSTVRIIEHGADGANLWPDRMADHFVKPTLRDDFDIVVKETEDSAMRVLDGEVIQRRIIERRIIIEHMDILLPAELCEQRKRLRIVGTVVDDQDLVGA